ncbi:DUF2155 domain-containing protein [soil metagenome]
MRRAGLIAASSFAVAVLATVGLALAQPPSSIGDLLQKDKSGPAPKDEAPPPAADQVPKAVAPTPPVKSTAKVTPDTGPVPAAVAAGSQAAAKAAAAPVAPVIPPPARPRYPIAILQALDKVTAESIRFEAPVGQPVRYRNLVFTVRSCEVTASEELARDAIAFVEVESRVPKAGRTAATLKPVFKGWFFAASPSVNPLQHPVYDAWLIACKA